MRENGLRRPPLCAVIVTVDRRGLRPFTRRPLLLLLEIGDISAWETTSGEKVEGWKVSRRGQAGKNADEDELVAVTVPEGFANAHRSTL